MKIISYIIFFFGLNDIYAQINNSISASMKTADFLEKRGDIDGALAIYEDILNKNPNNNISMQKIKSLLIK